MKNKFIGLVLLVTLAGCAVENNRPLPILGERDFVERQVNGVTTVDTIYYALPNFAFYNQDSILITQESLKGKIYVADFFFTSCPTICPVMKKNMLKVQEAYANETQLQILSHSIDPRHDSVMRLRAYGERMGIDPQKWYLLTGDKAEIYDAAAAYMVSAAEDESAPGGFIHSGALVLVDKQHRIRGYYDGTIDSEVEALMRDIAKLLKEG